MLNALRHQRKNHGIPGLEFQIEKSAQRLAASTEKPQPICLDPLDLLRVLNALRHQRKNHWIILPLSHSYSPCSTPCGINGKTTIAAPKSSVVDNVLNALRHQRKNHSLGSLANSLESLCSTPCGINGKTTRRSIWKPRNSIQVLNALRHQRKNHSG